MSVIVNGRAGGGGTLEPLGDASELDRLYLRHVASLEGAYARALSAGGGGAGWDALVVHSGTPLKRSVYDDQLWALRPCPHFRHWLPLAEPDALLVLRPGQRSLLIRTAEASFWERPPPPESEAFHEALDVVTASTPAEARQLVGGGHVVFVGEDASRAEAYGASADGHCPAELIARLDALRTTKTPYEIACIAEANRRARAGHEALRDAFRSGRASELDLHLLYLQATAQDDWETPYKNIVALGPHAATLHHVAYGRQPSRGTFESLLVDAGATCRGYGSDVTRTWCRGLGAEADAFAGLVAGLEAMQQRLCAAVRVGCPYEELHDASHRETAGILREAGIVRGSVEAIVAAGVTRAFYPHGLGHSLGLQTHDVGCGLRTPKAENPFLRNTSLIEVGQVFTIEPGVYFIDALLAPLRARPEGAMVDWRAVDALAPLGGIRIEDDVHVEGGERVVRNMTREQLPLGGGKLD
jgi:Xaa-Pro dipeptidase